MIDDQGRLVIIGAEIRLEPVPSDQAEGLEGKAHGTALFHARDYQNSRGPLKGSGSHKTDDAWPKKSTRCMH